jgi:hypothetical protein
VKLKWCGSYDVFAKDVIFCWELWICFEVHLKVQTFSLTVAGGWSKSLKMSSICQVSKYRLIYSVGPFLRRCQNLNLLLCVIQILYYFAVFLPSYIEHHVRAVSIYCGRLEASF